MLSETKNIMKLGPAMGAFLILGCSATPGLDGSLRFDNGRVVSGDRFDEIQIEGRCFLTAKGHCVPCGGGELLPCSEWVDRLRSVQQIPTQDSQTSSQTVGSPINIGYQIPDSDLPDMFEEIANSNGIAFDHASLLSGFGLENIAENDVIDFHGLVTEWDVLDETATIVYVTRSDLEFGEPGDFLAIDAYILGDGIADTPDPMIVRLSGDMSAVVDALGIAMGHHVSVDYMNSYGSWSIQAVTDVDGTAAANVYLNDVFVQTY